MDQEEYKLKIDGIDADCQMAKSAVARRYAQDNSSVKNGDVIEDHMGKILVSRIQFSFSMTEFPQCIYTGKELKKNGEPRKDGKVRDVWQGNLVTL